MTYWNDIMTLILWLNFLQHNFPEETNKLKKFASNFQIYLYSQYEVLMKRNGIDIFCDDYIEPVTIIEDDDDYKDDNEYDEDIIKIFNKHRQLSKSNYSNNDDNDIADDDIADTDNDIVNSNSNNIDSNIVSNNNIKIEIEIEGKEKIA